MFHSFPVLVASPDDPWETGCRRDLGGPEIGSSDVTNVLREQSATLVGISHTWSASYSHVDHFIVTSFPVPSHPLARPAPPL